MMNPAIILVGTRGLLALCFMTYDKLKEVFCPTVKLQSSMNVELYDPSWISNLKAS